MGHSRQDLTWLGIPSPLPSLTHGRRALNIDYPTESWIAPPLATQVMVVLLLAMVRNCNTLHADITQQALLRGCCPIWWEVWGKTGSCHRRTLASSVCLVRTSMKEPPVGDQKEVNPQTMLRTESQCLHFSTPWSLKKSLPVFLHPPLNYLKMMKCPCWAGWPNGKIGLTSTLLVRSGSPFWAGGAVIRWKTRVHAAAVTHCKRKLLDISVPHCLFTKLQVRNICTGLFFLPFMPAKTC